MIFFLCWVPRLDVTSDWTSKKSGVFHLFQILTMHLTRCSQTIDRKRV